MEFSQDTIAILEYVLPGFITAWVLYNFTSHVRPSQFERVIQAFIFNFFIQAIDRIGTHLEVSIFLYGVPEIARTALIACLLGFTLVICVNTDVFHGLCRFLGITKETSYPSVWYGNFSRCVTYVVLNLKDGRRLYGWPTEWPSKPDGGHFAIQQASWLVKQEGSDAPKVIELDTLDRVLISVQDVEFIEFLKPLKRNIDDQKA